MSPTPPQPETPDQARAAALQSLAGTFDVLILGVEPPASASPWTLPHADSALPSSKPETSHSPPPRAPQSSSTAASATSPPARSTSSARPSTSAPSCSAPPRISSIPSPPSCPPPTPGNSPGSAPASPPTTPLRLQLHGPNPHPLPRPDRPACPRHRHRPPQRQHPLPRRPVQRRPLRPRPRPHRHRPRRNRPQLRRCTGLHTTGGKLSGASIVDHETGTETTIQARCIVNATGIFSDELRHLDQPARPPLLTVSRGSHIVVDAAFLPGSHALMVPKTEDGRVIFAIPWQGAVIVGTTDIPASAAVMEPTTTEEEIAYLLAHIRPYLARPIERSDIRAIFAGLRPLVTGKENKTSKLSREHHIDASPTGLVTIAGGKWTTYRRMAQDTLDFAIRAHLLPPAKCVTATLPLHACPPSPSSPDPILAEYGNRRPALAALAATDPTLAVPLDPALPYTHAMAVFAVRHELARTVEDVLSRRTRALLLDAPAALRAAPAVAALMSRELGRDQAWITAQLHTFTTLANTHYIPVS